MCCLLQYAFRNVADASSPASVNNRHSARFLTEHVPGLGNKINSVVTMGGRTSYPVQGNCRAHWNLGWEKTGSQDFLSVPFGLVFRHIYPTHEIHQ